MRAMLEFVSILAVGLFAAAVIAVGAASVLPGGLSGVGIGKLDYASVGVGLIIGALISSISRIGWAEVPRRAAAYMVSKLGTIRLLGWGVVFAGVLLLY